MQLLKNSTLRLCAQIGWLLFFYFICRALFVIKYGVALNIIKSNEILEVFIGGLRFDLSAIFATNLLFIFLSLIPFKFTDSKVYQIGLKFIFIIINGIFILMNLIDIAYFSFVQKRMQFDTLRFVSGGKGDDFFNLLPGFLLEYWYLGLSYFIIMISLVWGYSKSRNIKTVSSSSKFYLYRSVLLVFFVGISILFIRGGLQLKPLNIIHASQMTAVKNIPAILNSPFSVIKTMNKKVLKKLEYFSEEEIKNLGIHYPNENINPNKRNVVIIIVESLSKKHLGYFNGKGQTPFLDSLFAYSAVFSNGIANARESVQGIPAIISSIPSWHDEPFIFSNYATNNITSLPSLLKKQGYHSSFFHGGTNGTMGFNAFSSLAGFDNYYGRDEYANEIDFDGNWGIWDEPFLQFMAEKISTIKKPFISAVFTLNPHHPFEVPQKHKKEFQQAGHPIFTSLRYTDYSIAKFFSKIKNEPWFKNTLFVITADHTAPGIDNSPATSLDDHRIPIAFYLPDNSLQSINSKIASQIDILPSVLHLLHYPEPFYSIGQNLFDINHNHTAMFYSNGVYQLVKDSILYQFNGSASVGLYNWQKEEKLQNNLIHNINPKILAAYELQTKQKLQVYNNRLINNNMYFQK